MASRLRGMTVLSSTVVPRTQRLLETGVLTERPLWLDVVEAYPPLPPPVLPEMMVKGRLHVIKYPKDAVRKEKRLLADKAQFSHPQQDFTSLFESRSLTRVPHWTFEKVELQKPEFETNEEISSVSAEQTETRIEVTSTKEEEKEEEDKVEPQFTKTIASLVSMLKDYENKDEQ